MPSYTHEISYYRTQYHIVMIHAEFSTFFNMKTRKFILIIQFFFFSFCLMHRNTAIQWISLQRGFCCLRLNPDASVSLTLIIEMYMYSICVCFSSLSTVICFFLISDALFSKQIDIHFILASINIFHVIQQFVYILSSHQACGPQPLNSHTCVSVVT